MPLGYLEFLHAFGGETKPIHARRYCPSHPGLA